MAAAGFPPLIEREPAARLGPCLPVSSGAVVPVPPVTVPWVTGLRDTFSVP